MDDVKFPRDEINTESYNKKRHSIVLDWIIEHANCNRTVQQDEETR